MTFVFRHDSADITVRRIGADDVGACEAFVARQETSLFYYSIEFRRVLADVNGAADFSLCAWRDNTPVGILPTMGLNGNLGMVLNAMPFFGSNGAPIAVDDEVETLLWSALLDIAKDQNVAATTVIANPLKGPVSDPSQLMKNVFVDRRVGYITPLAGLGTSDALWRAIDGSARRNVRKAEREGVVVEHTPDGWAFLEEIHRENAEVINAPPKPAAFFRAVRRHLSPQRDYRLYTARIDGIPVAALLLFFRSRTVEYYMPTIHRDHRSTQPLAAILWQAMTNALNDGFAYWNWGGCPASHVDLRRFKRKWGGRETVYQYFSFIQNLDILKTSPAVLQREYPYFFVVPFDVLDDTAGITR